MMSQALYIETSALLRIVLEHDAGLRAALASAGKLVASALTFVEAERGLARAARDQRIDPAQRREGQRWVRAVAKSCDTMALDADVLDRARGEFPAEPIRTLDALHLATALIWDETFGELTIASCDERVRANAAALGLPLVPA
jgi:hypothetical protein